MDLKTKVNSKDITITLTKEQVEDINRQSKKFKTVKDINSLEDAEEVLKDCKTHKKQTRKDFPNNNKYWNQYTLETIIKAANFIDNNFIEWLSDFTDSSYKYINWFEKRDSGWVLDCVGCLVSISCCGLGFYFKKEDSAKLIVNKFLLLYNQVIENK